MCVGSWEFKLEFHNGLDTARRPGVPNRKDEASLFFCFLEAVGAITADFRARPVTSCENRARSAPLNARTSGFEFPNLAAAQARHMNVIARTVRLVIVAIPAKM